MPSRRVEFDGSQGVSLAGRLDTPDGPLRGWAVFAHCFTCSKESRAAAFIARSLAEAGFGVLRFDFTGLGGSGGDFANTHFSSNVDDLIAAADWLREQHGPPALLVGHSLGGAAVLAAAGRVPDCVAVATLGAPFEPTHVTDQFRDQLALIERDGEATVTLAGRPFRIRREFVADLAGQAQSERIRSLRRPLLILHSPVDRIVDVDNARRIYETALHPKSFVSLDTADHLLTEVADARYAAGLIAQWSGRYLPAQAPSTTVPAAAAAAAQSAAEPADFASGPMATAAVTLPAALTPGEGNVLVSERGTGNFTVSVSDGKHTWLADEPASVGGDDLGPTPYDLLAAALGTCTVMTMRMYARRKKWDVGTIRCAVRHSKVAATDEAAPPGKDRADLLERVVAIDGPVDDSMLTRLIEIADRCPVHRTLHGEIQVTTRLATDG